MIQNKAKNARVTKLRKVPGDLMPGLRKEVVWAYEAGRSHLQTAKEYCATQGTVFELFDRAILARLREVERRLAMLECEQPGPQAVALDRRRRVAA